MTIELTNCFKRFAKDGLKTIGINVFMKNLSLLECGWSEQKEIDFSHKGKLFILNNCKKYVFIDYVMIRDEQSNKEYQIYFDYKFVAEEYI